MRTGELLKALTREDPGIEIRVSSRFAYCTTLYQPHLRGIGKTFFDAAFEVATELISHPDCPPRVKDALDDYDRHTHILGL